MGKLLENFTVLDNKKRIICEKINDQEFCSEFFSQVLGAFDALTQHISDGDLSDIIWGDKLISMKKKEDLIFLACCDADQKETKIREVLGDISQRFIEIYSKILIDEFDGDRSIFANSEARFLEELKKYID